MQHYWLIPNSMYPVLFVVKANAFRRLLRRLGVAYDNVKDTVQAPDKACAMVEFEKKGYDLGFRKYGLPSMTEVQSSASNEEKSQSSGGPTNQGEDYVDLVRHCGDDHGPSLANIPGY